jgi:hypothetical protein
MPSPEISPDVPSAPAPPTTKKGLFTPRTMIPVALVLLVLVFFLARSHASFDWRSLGPQLRSVSPTLILIADLGRPYLIARRLKTPVATQLAVYSIERAFDLAAAAIIFSATLAFAPRNMPHHEAFARAGIVSLAATLFLAVFALSLRFAGKQVARIAATLFRPISAPFALSTSERILEFSQGLHIVSTLSEFLSALAISVGMWLVVAVMYLETIHAFRATPSLANLSFAATMLLLATSLGGSLLQLPILGWFTQIALLAAALHGFFNVPLESATACAAALLVTANLAVIPGGFLAAQLEGISLREAAKPTAV